MSNESIPVPVETELDALFGQYTAAGQALGLVYGMTGPGGLLHSAGFGTVNDAGLVPDENTVFPIASMTKSFVACAALLARDRGALSLEDPITKWLPEFSAAGTAEDPCQPPTLGMLFSMSGGLTEDNSWVDPLIDATEQDLLAQVSRGLRYSHLPGTVYEYSNLGYTLAALAVARAVGQPIERFVENEVLAPLGLTSTCFDNAAPADIVRASGYSLDPNGQWVPFPHMASGAFAAAGGLMSSVRDLATWVTWLGSAFRAPDSLDAGPLSRSSRRELQRIHMVETPSITTQADGGLHFDVSGYGLGLFISMDLRRGTVVSHAGGLPGFILFMAWHPDSGSGIVVLTNSHRGEPSALATEALGRVLARNSTAAETIVLWPETVELRKSAEQLIRNWDDALADRIFAENVDFDRPLKQRRAEIDQLVGEIGPLGDPTPVTDIVSAATAADVTWSIPGARGELLCMIHLTPVNPARIQEFVVQAIPAGRPRSARPIDISPRRRGLGEAFLGQMGNVRVLVPPAREPGRLSSDCDCVRLCRAGQQAANLGADILHRFPVGRAQGGQRGREDAVLLFVDVSAQECQRYGQPVRPGGVCWRARQRLAENRGDVLVLGLQDGHLVREVGREGGEQATFFDLGMRAEHGSDLGGEFGHPRHVTLVPCYPGFTDQAKHQVMLPS